MAGFLMFYRARTWPSFPVTRVPGKRGVGQRRAHAAHFSYLSFAAQNAYNLFRNRCSTRRWARCTVEKAACVCANRRQISVDLKVLRHTEAGDPRRRAVAQSVIALPRQRAQFSRPGLKHQLLYDALCSKPSVRSLSRSHDVTRIDNRSAGYRFRSGYVG
jgi:hypothetical protein